jgi:hypothetical protein
MSRAGAVEAVVGFISSLLQCLTVERGKLAYDDSLRVSQPMVKA